MKFKKIIKENDVVSSVMSHFNTTGKKNNYEKIHDLFYNISNNCMEFNMFYNNFVEPEEYDEDREQYMEKTRKFLVDYLNKNQNVFNDIYNLNNLFTKVVKELEKIDANHYETLIGEKYGI